MAIATGFRGRGQRPDHRRQPSAHINDRIRVPEVRVIGDDSGSDVKPLPPKLEWLNRVLTGALVSEARILRNPRASLPAGLSAICIAEKPHNCYQVANKSGVRQSSKLLSRR